MKIATQKAMSTRTLLLVFVRMSLPMLLLATAQYWARRERGKRKRSNGKEGHTEVFQHSPSHSGSRRGPSLREPIYRPIPSCPHLQHARGASAFLRYQHLAPADP